MWRDVGKLHENKLHLETRCSFKRTLLMHEESKKLLFFFPQHLCTLSW